MAAAYTLYAEKQPFQWTMLAESLYGILAAGGGEPAGGRKHRGDGSLIKSYREYEQPGHNFRESGFHFQQGR